MTITLRPYQAALVSGVYDAWNSGARNALAVLPTGGGKCHGLNTPILMFDGTVKMVQDVRAGDFVMGPDSEPRFVMATTNGFDELFRVQPTKGDSYVVNSQHILSLRRTSLTPNDPAGGAIVNIPVLAYLAANKTFKHIHKGWRTGIDFNNRTPLKIDPYFLGIWLGDGTTLGTSVTTMDGEVKQCVEQEASSRGLAVRIETKPNNRAVTMHIHGPKGKRENTLKDDLRHYGLLGDKHIPLDYKTAPRQQRLELLAGILDSDGHYTGKSYDVVFKVEKLLDDLLFLARSLGFSAYKKETEKTCTNNGVTGTYYRCSINGHLDEIPCRVQRQKAKPRRQIKNVTNVGITVEPIGYGPYFGFQVAGPDSLYLLGDFTVTHNSVVVSQIALDRDQIGANQCIMAHRTELVSQMSMHVARRGVFHRIIAPTNVVRDITRQQRQDFGRSFINPDARCAVAAAQTLVARLDSLKEWGHTVHNWTVDESHHLLRQPNLWGRAVGLFPNALGLGVTATPARADGMGLGRHADGLMDTMLLGPTMRELIDEGSLTDYEIVAPQSDFEIDDGAITGSGDYSPTKMREASKKSHITGDVVTEYMRHAYGRRAICFATDVQTANDIARKFTEAGIPAASVSAKTPTEVRADFIRKFQAGLLWVMVNVDLFDEGFDCPGCDVVIMARPTASLGKYMQQFGRALRPDPNNPSKVALVIDHVSNWKRHSFPDKPRIWTLDRREKRAKKTPDPEEIPLTVCRSCSRPYERFHAACPYCGEMPVAVGGGRTLEQVDGDLLLLDRDKLAELRKAMELEAPASVAERVGHAAGPIAAKGAFNAAVARHAAQERLSGAIAQWAAIERDKGRPDSQTYRRFYLTLGVDVLTALSGKRDEMDRLAEIVEGWYEN